MVTAAKSEAPAVIPNKSGVASGLRNIPCKQVPDTDRALPIRIAMTIRGSLRSISTKRSLSEMLPSLLIRPEKISVNECFSKIYTPIYSETHRQQCQQ